MEEVFHPEEIIIDMYLSTLALLTFVSSLSGVLAVPSAQTKHYAVRERHVVPDGWTAIARPEAHHPITLRIGLKRQNEHVLEQHALEVSDPSHARYGQYLSAADINKLVVPAEDTVDLVQAWLRDHDIATSSLSAAKDWIFVTVPVAKVEQLLQTEYSVYRHLDGSTLVRAPEWSLPEHLHEHIDVVQPTNSFFRTVKQARSSKPRIERLKPGSGNWWTSHTAVSTLPDQRSCVSRSSLADLLAASHHRDRL